MRSNTILLLSLSLLATAGQNALIGPIRFSNLALLDADISAVIYALLGGLVLVYWFFVEPDYRREVRPLGVAIMAVESMVIGVSILAAGAFLLLFPIIGLVGVIGGGIGLGLLWLGRGLWNGKPWALEVMLLFTVIGIVAGLIGLAFGLGVPILGLYQFWYLRRHNVKDFYYWKPAPQSAISLRTATGEESLLRIEGLRTYFYTYAGIVKAVDGVSLQVGQGETVGIVGESGSGKTVTALSIMRIVPPPGRIVEGRIIFQGRDILDEREEDVQRLRGKEIGYIFQDPTSTLDPVYTVGQQLCEVLMRHQNLDPKTALARAIELLRLVEIPDPEVRINQYPHELSGGTKQRIAIARALSCNPSLLLADEPTTALDVTIQAQILELMKSLKSKFNMSMVLISHDLGVVAETCDRIVILYAGQVYESGTTAQVLENPKHPYTESLLTSVPSLALRKGRLSVIPGNIPNLIDPPSGCRFHPRCKYAQQICIDKVPELEVMEEGHLAACHRAKELKLISPVAS